MLTFHQIQASQAAAFERQLEAITRAGRTVAGDYCPAPTDTRRAIAVTFDDGLAEAFEVALPVLKEKGIPSTWFLTTGYLGRSAGWIRDHTHASFGGRLVTLGEVKAQASPLFRVGTHTASHARLPALGLEQVAFELRIPRRELQQALGTTITLFAFPYGAYCEKLLSLCHDEGYRRVFANVPVWRRASRGGFLQGRVSVEPTDWGVEFWLKLRGGYNWLAVTGFLRHHILPRLRGCSGVH